MHLFQNLDNLTEKYFDYGSMVCLTVGSYGKTPQKCKNASKLLGQMVILLKFAIKGILDELPLEGY